MSIVIILILMILIYVFILYISIKIKKNKLLKSLKKHIESTIINLHKIPTEDERLIDKPISFGTKCMWFAVKSGDKEKIISKLRYIKIGECNWQTGVSRAYSGAIFLTPKIGDWTLVYGNGISIDGGSLKEINEIKKILKRLSKEFSEAHFFNTHRIVEYHCWIKAINGNIERAYAFLGEKCETIINEGEPTFIEQKYNLINTLSEESKEDGYFDRDDIVFPNESLVMEIANSWSINPCELEIRNDIKNELGVILV
jgi:hypothetical protein